MTKIRLRGLKLLEGGAQVVSYCPAGENLLGTSICAPLAINKINLTFLTHLSPDKHAACSTVLCTEGTAGRAAASIIEAHQSSGGVNLQERISTLSIFVHDQRPQVSGAMLEALTRGEVRLLGLASSPSAISSIVLAKDTEAAITALFDPFQFPAYSSPSHWYAAYEGKEHLLRKIIASYQEEVIRIYDIVQEPALDFWSLVLPASKVGNLGAALIALDRLEIKMPFVAAQPSSEGRLRFVFCFPPAHASEISRGLAKKITTKTLTRHCQVVALFIHGPHFGDRYGIANTLVGALERSGVHLLALSCTVSSISAVIREADLDPAIRTLDMTFQRSST